MSAGPACVLVLASAHGVIGRDNALPWHLPEDLAHFKALTSGHCIIMGRKTFESIGRPLPQRRSIVVSRQAPGLSLPPGVEQAGSLEAALHLSQQPCAQLQAGAAPWPTDPVFVIGGAQLYREALPLANRIELTEIDLHIEGDAHFPTPDPAQWVRSQDGAEGDAWLTSRTGLAYRFVTLRRR